MAEMAPSSPRTICELPPGWVGWLRVVVDTRHVRRFEVAQAEALEVSRLVCLVDALELVLQLYRRIRRVKVVYVDLD